MLRVIRDLLINMGFTDIDEATDGDMALRKFNNGDYGLIVSDWNMRPGSGYDFLCAVRRGVKNKNVPFVMVTAESAPEKVVKAKKAGVSGYIVKPFDADTLTRKIKNVMSDY